MSKNNKKAIQDDYDIFSDIKEKNNAIPETVVQKKEKTKKIKNKSTINHSKKKDNKGKFVSDEDSWNSKIKKVIEIAENLKRWPSAFSDDEEERYVSEWWSKMRWYASKKIKNTNKFYISYKHALEIKQIIERFPNLNREKKWDYKLRQVELKILASRRLWSMSVANENQKKLINWWSQQKNKIKKHKKGIKISGMNEERAKKVERLMGFERHVYKKKSLNKDKI